MKKILLCLFACLLLVGCGKTQNQKQEEQQVEEPKVTNSVLVCSKGTEGSVNFNTDMSLYFENDTLVKLGVKYVYDLSEYNEEQRKAFASANLCSTDSIKDTLGMNDCKEQLQGTNYIVEGSAPKLLEQSKGKLTEVKTSFEKQGWICSVY